MESEEAGETTLVDAETELSVKKRLADSDVSVHDGDNDDDKTEDKKENLLSFSNTGNMGFTKKDFVKGRIFLKYSFQIVFLYHMCL